MEERLGLNELLHNLREDTAIRTMSYILLLVSIINVSCIYKISLVTFGLVLGYAGIGFMIFISDESYFKPLCIVDFRNPRPRDKKIASLIEVIIYLTFALLGLAASIYSFIDSDAYGITGFVVCLLPVLFLYFVIVYAGRFTSIIKLLKISKARDKAWPNIIESIDLLFDKLTPQMCLIEDDEELRPYQDKIETLIRSIDGIEAFPEEAIKDISKNVFLSIVTKRYYVRKAMDAYESQMKMGELLKKVNEAKNSIHDKVDK